MLLIVVIAVVAILAILNTRSQDGGADEVWPFYAKKPLSQPEQVLYFRLVQALPEHIILAQVQTLPLAQGQERLRLCQAWFNRIRRMNADFVVCNKNASILAVIELGDSTHQRKDRQATDAKKDKVLSSANIQIVRWQVKMLPNIVTIQSTFMPNSIIKQGVPKTVHPLALR